MARLLYIESNLGKERSASMNEVGKTFFAAAHCNTSVIPSISHNLHLLSIAYVEHRCRKRTLPTEVVLRSDYVILAEIIPDLNLYDLQKTTVAQVLKSMFGLCGYKLHVTYV